MPEVKYVFHPDRSISDLTGAEQAVDIRPESLKVTCPAPANSVNFFKKRSHSLLSWDLLSPPYLELNGLAMTQGFPL